MRRVNKTNCNFECIQNKFECGGTFAFSGFAFENEEYFNSPEIDVYESDLSLSSKAANIIRPEINCATCNPDMVQCPHNKPNPDSPGFKRCCTQIYHP